MSVESKTIQLGTIRKQPAWIKKAQAVAAIPMPDGGAGVVMEKAQESRPLKETAGMGPKKTPPGTLRAGQLQWLLLGVLQWSTSMLLVTSTVTSENCIHSYMACEDLRANCAILPLEGTHFVIQAINSEQTDMTDWPHKAQQQPRDLLPVSQ
ncbi:hypothetical protein P7K49_002627, partial [Saguinus oedipus]